MKIWDNVNLIVQKYITCFNKSENILQGEVVREFMKDTDSINMYKNMRETLVYLTHLDYADTERIMTEKLQNQVRFQN